MAKFKPQYRRLLHIDRRIREARYPNCTTLAREWEVSAKTIQRDVDYLRDELNAPIEYDAVKHGLYYTEASFRLPAIQVSESDLFAVCIAEQSLKQFEDTPLYAKLRSVFDKIEASLPQHVKIDPSWVDGRIVFLREPRTHLREGIWENIALAVREQRQLKVTHRSPKRDRLSSRRVDPYRLANYRGEWYLIAFCHKSCAVRTFAVSRISEALIMDSEFAPPQGFSLDAVLGDHFGIMWGEDAFEVRIAFDVDVSPYIREREWHPKQRIVDKHDGSLVLEFPTNHLNEVKDWVLSWGPNAQVLAPALLRSKVKRALNEARRLYT